MLEKSFLSFRKGILSGISPAMMIYWRFWKIMKVRGFGKSLGVTVNGPKAKTETEVALRKGGSGRREVAW